MNLESTAHYTSLAKALVSLYGSSVSIVHTDRLSGGDINKSYALTLNTGDRIFMKANAKENAAFFTAEAAGLSAIAETECIGTPRTLCTGTDDGEEVTPSRTHAQPVAIYVILGLILLGVLIYFLVSRKNNKKDPQ